MKGKNFTGKGKHIGSISYKASMKVKRQKK